MVVTALGLIGGGRGDAGKVRAGRDRAERGDPLGTGGRPHVRASGPRTRPGRRLQLWVEAVVDSAGGRFDDDGTLIAARTRRRRRAVARPRRGSGRAAGHADRTRRAADRGARPVGGHLPAPTRAAAGGARPVRRPAPRRSPSTASCAPAGSGWPPTWPTAAPAPGNGLSGNSCCGSGWPRSRRADPQPGEDRELVDEVRRLQNLDGLRAAAAGAHESLTGTDETVARAGRGRAGARRAAPAGRPPTIRGSVNSPASCGRPRWCWPTSGRNCPGTWPAWMTTPAGSPRCWSGRRAALAHPPLRRGRRRGAAPGPARPPQELLELDSSEDRLARRQTELDDLRRRARPAGRPAVRRAIGGRGPAGPAGHRRTRVPGHGPGHRAGPGQPACRGPGGFAGGTGRPRLAGGRARTGWTRWRSSWSRTPARRSCRSPRVPPAVSCPG